MPKPGHVIAERFALERIAGRGATSEVWLAQDLNEGRPVALKLVRIRESDALVRFHREIELLEELNHPGIVRPVAHGEHDGAPFLALEWLEGEDLASRLQRTGLSITEALSLAQRLAEALGALHAEGIIHRDVKPGNIFIVGGDVATAKLLDFGIARVERDAGVSTQPGEVVGTPSYMAPEQARGDRNLDGRADLFSLGAVMYEVLTGFEPFPGAHTMAILAKVLMEDPPPPSMVNPRLSPAIDNLVGALLQKDPARRIPSAAALEDALVGLMTEDVPPSWTSPSSLRRPALGPSEQRLLCVAIARPPGHVTAGSAPPAGASRPSRTSWDRVSAPTLLPVTPREEHRPLAKMVAELGGRLERLADGSVLAVISGRDARDEAMAGARLALGLRRELEGHRVALSTGWGDSSAALPVGDAVERAVQLLDRGLGKRAVAIDEVTTGLLDARFAIGGSEHGLELWGERPSLEAERLLLGRPTPCFGRAGETERLLNQFEGVVREGRARVVLVVGAPGVGKSRLRFEFLQSLWARGHRAQVLLGRGDPSTTDVPLSLIAPAMRRTAGILDSDDRAAIQRKLRQRIERRVDAAERARIELFLAELIGAPLSEQESRDHINTLRTARQDPTVMGAQMRRAFEDFLFAEVTDSPLVLVLEDAQWADASSLSFIHGALRALRDKPLFVLAITRPESADNVHTVWREHRVERLDVGRLPPEAAAQLGHHALSEIADPARTRIVDRIVDLADGNALFLEELVRAVAQAGDTPRLDKLPRTVIAMVQTRLEALVPEQRRVLRAASLFGYVFWAEGVRALMGGMRRTSHVGEHLAALEAAELIDRRVAERFSGQAEYTFRHTLVRDAAYGMLTPADRELGHRLAAQWLERAGERDAVVIAEHYRQGNRPAEAVTWFAHAAQHAFEQNEFRSALSVADLAAECGAQGPELGALRSRQAQAAYWLGSYADAERYAEEALLLLDRHDRDWAPAAALAAATSLRRGTTERAAEISTDFMTTLRAGSASEEAHIAAADLVKALFQASDTVQARALLEELERQTPDEDQPPALRARILVAQGWDAFFSGHLDVSSDCYEPAARFFEEAGDVRSAAACRMNAASDLKELGAFAEAEGMLRRAMVDAERLGLDLVVGASQANLAIALARQGQLDEAHRYIELALAFYQARPDPRLGTVAMLFRSLIHLWSGHPSRALNDAKAALSVVVDPPIEALAQACRGLAELMTGALGNAVEAVLAADRIARTAAPLEEGEGLVWLAVFKVLEAKGDMPGARAAIEQARRRLEQRAAALTRADRRRTFLYEIPEHAETLALAEHWLGPS